MAASHTTEEEYLRVTTPPPSTTKRTYLERSPSGLDDQRSRPRLNPKTSPEKNSRALVPYHPYQRRSLTPELDKLTEEERRFTFTTPNIIVHDTSMHPQDQQTAQTENLVPSQPLEDRTPIPPQPSENQAPAPPGQTNDTPHDEEPDEAPLSTPPGGFPRLEGLCQDDILATIQANKITHWNDAEDQKVLVFAAYDEVTTKALDRRKRFEIYIRKALRTNQNPKMLIPTPVFISGRNRRIFPYLVYNLTQVEADTLTNRHCWAFQAFTFFAIPFHFPNPSFLFTLHDVPLELSEESYKEVKQCVVSCLRANPEFTLFVNKVIKGNLDLAVRVDGIDSPSNNPQVYLTGSPIYRVHIEAPPLSKSKFKDWRDIIQRTTFDSATVSGTVQKPDNMLCILCKSLGHRKVNCPYPKIAGWPTAHPYDKDANESGVSTSSPQSITGRGRGKGPRGRRGGYQPR